MTQLIKSPTNPRVKSIVRLRNRRERDETGAFVVEGIAEVRKAMDSHVECLELFATQDVSEDLLSDASDLEIRAASGTPIRYEPGTYAIWIVVPDL